ncbi:MAG: single-stranded-DNA-specific exonuclease RecJ, partial [Gemmataceae bacterium]
NGLHPPELLPGAKEAAERIHAAVLAKRRICVYGDYDVDGLTGASILWRCLQLLGTPADYYVPNRLEEGYGLNVQALQRIKEAGASLVVTVDCGIANMAEAAEARRLGLELIVTDHHEPKETLPAADVLVHPRLPGTTYPFGELSGSGVAFKLAWALCQVASGATKVTPEFREFLLDSVVLASLGMIADVVPLIDENRIFVRHGMMRLRQTTSPGLRALLEACQLHEKPAVRASDVAYFMAPRLNAAGRLGCARLVIELLTTNSRPKAIELARFLDFQNQQRQTIERRILHQARAQLGEELPDALVLANHDWHAGVIGIVAGRLAEHYGRPALLIALNEAARFGVGSGRSIPGFPLHQALDACRDGLLSHGGHAAAAGFKIDPTFLDDFRQRFCSYTTQFFPGGMPPPRLVLDAELPLSVLTPKLIRHIAQLEPYGAGNPRPLFLCGPVQVVGTPKRIGGGERHLSFRVRQHGSVFRAIGFSLAERCDELLAQEGWCFLAFTPFVNEWNGFRSVELEVRDFQAGQTANLV